MSTDWYEDVFAFHEKFNCAVGVGGPAIPSQGTKNLREDLLREEFDETIRAMDRDDLPGVADGIADLIYVAVGLAVSYGIDLRPVWNAVHAANMAKEGGRMRQDGKIMKPAGWKAPNVKALLVAQGMEAA